MRQRQSAADTLRRRSQAAKQVASAASGAFDSPARTPRPATTSRRNIDIVMPVAQRETPQIEKNELMRGETGPRRRRRSSVSRGKRIGCSYEATGVICEWHMPLCLHVRSASQRGAARPHTCVSVARFFKHIDSELLRTKPRKLLHRDEGPQTPARTHHCYQPPRRTC